MAWCLIKKYTEEFKEKLKTGEIHPDILIGLDSAGRRNFFAQMFGEENAKHINALFESKILLKNQKQGYVTWAKKVSGITEPARGDLVSRINRLDKVLNPAEEKLFLEDLAAQKLGIGVTPEEAKRISELAKKTEELRKFPEKRIEYGNALLDFNDYVNSLNPKKASILQNVINLPKTLKSTLDLSAPLRQGLPMITRKEWYVAFANMFRYALSEKAFRGLQADIISRPTYELMKDGGLRVSSLATKLDQREEEFMSQLVSKIPGLRGSERAYVGFLSRLRADVFDTLIKQAELAGEDIRKGSQAVKDIANFVNDFTGSGNIGIKDKYAGSVPWLNSALFSPRKISATVNMFNPERYLNPNISKTARKAALKQLVGLLGFATTALGLASMAGADVETDSNSTDFGKIKIGNTRFDITGGNANYITLLSRIISGKTKSGKGKIYKLGEGYKGTTRGDLLLRFVRNKLSPMAGELVNLFEGSNFLGEKIKLTSEVRNTIEPMIISSFFDLIKEDKEMIFFALLSELFGVGTQTYK